MISSMKLKNLSTGSEVVMGDTNENYLLDENGVDWGVVEASHSTYAYQQQVGSEIESTTLTERTIKLVGYVWHRLTDQERIGKTQAEVEQALISAIESKKRTLNSLFNPIHYIEAKVGDFCIEGKPTSTIVYSRRWDENNEIKCKFNVNLFCNKPMWKTVAENVNMMSNTYGRFRFPLVFTPEKLVMGVREVYDILEMQNAGDNSVGVLIEFEAIAYVSNPTIQNLYTGELIKVHKNLVAGEKILIDTRAKTIKGYIGETELNYFKYWDFENTWLQMHAGANLIVYGADGEGYKVLNVTVTYNEERMVLDNQ